MKPRVLSGLLREPRGCNALYYAAARHAAHAAAPPHHRATTATHHRAAAAPHHRAAAAPHTAPVPSTYFVSFAIRFVRKQASSIALRRVPPWPRKLRPLAFRDTYSHMATTIPLTVCAMAVVHKDALRTILVLSDQFSIYISHYGNGVPAMC